MSRCDHCQYIGSWDCEDSRVPDNKLCENFVLRFETLTDKQQKEIQKRLMSNNDENYNSYWYD